MVIFAEIIHRLFQLLILLVIVQAALSYFLSPYDPVRRVIDRIINPILEPIRRVLPPMGMFGFSPLVLIILLQLLDMLVRSLLFSVA